MLLDELTLEEKKAFWNIANVLAAVDGRVSEEESVLMQYKEEMGVDLDFVDPASVDIASELNSISGSGLRERKIVYFELFGVAYADTDFNEKEQKILDEVSSVLGISGDVKAVLEDSVRTIYDTYRKLGAVLGE